MTPEVAADLAARTLTAISEAERTHPIMSPPTWRADRERVASDLAGLRDCWDGIGTEQNGRHARRYADGLIRTAALYGVTP